MLHRTIWLAAVLMALPAGRCSAATISRIELNHGDVLVFLGDSITHQCLYTQYVEDYFYTRYPDRRINFHNAGVSGDRCADALVRFDGDIGQYKPKYVTVLLGMNDGGYRPYDNNTFVSYEKDLLAVLEHIQSIGATAVLMTPTMFDAQAARARKSGDEQRNRYYNATLAYYGALLREIAFTRSVGFVDMYGPLNNLTLQRRKLEPQFTMVADAVHPDAPGQAVMATAILEDMHSNRVVSSVEVVIDASGYPKVQSTGGKLIGIENDGGGKLGFGFRAASLPWVLPKEAAVGFRLSHAGHRLSRESLRVTGLAPGNYELSIDGAVVGAFAHDALARGIELQENEKTPQYRQALAVAQLNQQRNNEAIRPLRDLWLRRKIQRYAAAQVKADPKNAKAAQQLEQLNQQLAHFDKDVATLQAKAKGFLDRIYQSNQPREHRYELVGKR